MSFPKLRVLLAVAAALGSQAPLHAQDTASFPSKVIRIISPYAPGGQTDPLTRNAANVVSKKVGQPIIMENKPGAGTLIATRFVKEADADGYTLLMQSNGFVSNVHAFKDPGYSLADFKPVVVLGQSSYVLMTPSKLPARDVKEFVAYAKGRKDLSYGTLGQGGRTHILAEELAKQAGFNWQLIPFKGGADGVTALMGSHIHGYFASVGLAGPQAASPNLRLLAIASEERSEYLPNVPTFKEEGYPAMTDTLWIALFARANTPAPVLEKLRTLFAEAVNSPEFKAGNRGNTSNYAASLVTFESQMQTALKKTVQEFKEYNLTQQ